MRCALVQLTASDEPARNAPEAEAAVARAAAQGARIVLTPEVTNCVSASRTRQKEVLRPESADPVLAALRAAAAEHGVWVLAGSLALATDDGAPDDRFVNRSILIGPDGRPRARYDKIHMFDVSLSEAETYRESEGFRPGESAVIAQVDDWVLGLTICYDLRFPALYRRLAQAGATVLCVPAAFTVPTGQAHWETLLRARAIECGAYVLAPAQTGRHPATRGPARKTWGHSLAVDPWGAVIADGGTDPGLVLVDLDPAAVAQARRRVPALDHDRAFVGP